MRNKILIGIVIFCLFSVANAGSGWSQKGKIVEIYNFGWTIMVKLSGNPIDYSDGGACSDFSYYALNAKDNSKYDQLLSQLLMAHALGLDTQFWISGNSCQGQNSNKQKIVTIRTFR